MTERDRADEVAPASAQVFNPEMMKVARGAEGLSQSEFAEKMGTYQGKVSKWEDGLLVPGLHDVQRAANVLRYPTEMFYQSDRIYGFASCCVYHRKRISIPLKTLNQVHDRINVTRIRVSRLLKKSRIKSELEFPRYDIDEYDGNAQGIAQMMRSVWKVPMGPIKSLVHWVEAAGGIVIPMTMETDKLSAVSLWPPTLPPLFFLNNKIPADRWRFTLAHEIGHIVMHRYPTANAEEEADAFASEFLMPSREIKPELENLNLPTASRLKQRWRVSMQAIIRKARDTDAISPRRCKSLFSRLSQLGYRKREPDPIAQEYPTTLKSVVELHIAKLGYTMEDVARVALCVDEEQFRSQVMGEFNRLRIVK